MYERIKRLYDSKALTLEGLKNAVAKGLISADEFKKISGEVYE